ncbi:MAG: sulfur oxidation c-type cytochrome SoxA [Azospirillum sp.]|nr:sulfur oxidation c-type cytochrome SoxA [Azospirillum sp.]
MAAVVTAALPGAAQNDQGEKPSFLRNEYQAVKPEKANPLTELISGYFFRSRETQALQDDDFLNPGFLWVEQGQDLWSKPEGEAGKSCADCHQDAAATMKGVGASYPKVQPDGKLANLEGRINLCRTQYMKAPELKYDSDPLLALTAYVRHQSRGMPVKVAIDGTAAPYFEKGKEFYYTRRGQLDFSCASCHETNYGHYLRADFLSQGQSNGFPTYRLKWQKLGSLHRRLEGCVQDTRGETFKRGSEEFLALELYLAWRGQGLPVETPSVRQ